MACAGNGVGCVGGEARAGAVVGGAAVVADERPYVGSNRAAAASAGNSVLVFGVLTWGVGRCWHACNRFGDVVVVMAADWEEQWVRYTSWPHELGSCSPEAATMTTRMQCLGVLRD